ncbi:MAG: Fe-S cluster assembly sulfur transfer protein SufU, partial [Verrucomicrobiota bacterium]
MSEELTELYQEIILDHNKRPRNYRPLPLATHQAEGNNPMCGDEIEVYLRVEGDRIEEVTFQGQGCAISRASASLLTEMLTGKTVKEARAIDADVLDALRDSDRELDLAKDGDLAALGGVRQFPARIKCATLAWHAAEAA